MNTNPISTPKPSRRMLLNCSSDESSDNESIVSEASAHTEVSMEESPAESVSNAEPIEEPIVEKSDEIALTMEVGVNTEHIEPVSTSEIGINTDPEMIIPPLPNRWDMFFADEDEKEVESVWTNYKAKAKAKKERDEWKSQMTALQKKIDESRGNESGDDSGEDEPTVKRNTKNKKGRSTGKKYKKRAQEIILEHMNDGVWYTSAEVIARMAKNDYHYNTTGTYLSGKKYMIADGTIEKRKRAADGKNQYRKIPQKKKDDSEENQNDEN